VDLAIRNSVGHLAPGVDVRGDGGYIIAAPSVHPSRRRYAWLPGHTPWERERAPLDPRIIAGLFAPLPPRGARNGRGSNPTPRVPQPLGYRGAPPLGEAIAVGQRNVTLASLAGTMRRRNMSAAAILAALRVENAERCRPPLTDAEVHRIAASISRYPPG
jgi:hypothetical protein